MKKPRGFRWEDRAKRELRAIDREMALFLLNTLASFAKTGQGDVKQLQGIRPPEYRLRVGKYRVRFQYVEDTLVILAINHRKDAY